VQKTPSLKKQLAIYFTGLIALYLAAIIIFWPKNGAEQPNQAIFFVVMFAPTFGAIAVKLFAGGRIQFGKPNFWILAGFLPTLAALCLYLIGSLIGIDNENPALLKSALAASGVAIFTSSLSAIGEEIGWRGFMWPTIRKEWSFGRATLFTFMIWWVYHLPFILLGWYGSVSGLAAFTVGIAGFTVFIGAITDRSKSIWPSVIAHGSWNALVATSFAVTEGGKDVPAFSGSERLMGEFGWLAAISMLILGLATYFWHTNYLRNTQTSKS
jgi:membrane protease YdiL (CAAX protease family)